jgi:cation diffusion facilitator CzcD-associated flavoprotein CzcO
MPENEFDAIIIGAGMSGMYQLHRLRELGLSVRVFEAGDGVGGTWYWNRYPGARFDSESWTYGYSFDERLLEKWKWSEHFAAQPETLRYCNFVADELDLRRDIRFGTRITSARWEEATKSWEVESSDGLRARSRFLITAIGPLSAPTFPAIAGTESYRGEAYHTGRWPHEPVRFENKRVAVIGTGATGVQAITEIAKTAGHLTVFQRTPNWCAPLHNALIDEATQERIHATYPEIFEKCRNSFGCFVHDADPRNALDVSPETREAVFEKLYAEPGFGIWMGNFRDLLIDERANATITAFMERKIRERVSDPATAEKLIPRDHGFGTRRVPLESGYYEVFNQAGVELVDVREAPIERITPDGLETTRASYAFDMIVYATGFDAITGAFDRIDFRGTGGQRLRDKWSAGPRTYLGLQAHGFPNLFTLVGPHNAATFCNMPRCIEQNVDFVTALLRRVRERGVERVEASEAAETEWTAHVHEVAERMLFTRIDSWMTGINKNLASKRKRTVHVYAGGAPRYREVCDDVAADDYRGFDLG